MKKIGIFYSFNTKTTSRVAEKIKETIGENYIESVDVQNINPESLLKFDNLILGVPTWWDGELPTYWDEAVPMIEELDLTGKKVAIFGLGDQKGYPQNFADAVGIMAELMKKCGAQVVGYTSTDGYQFENSKAIENGKFSGLVIDQFLQAAQTNERIVNWIDDLKKAFEL